MRTRAGVADKRAVSEVLSTLFMVTVAIVLGALVGSVVLDVIGGVSDDPLAGVQVTFDPDEDDITVVYTATREKGTTIEVRVLDDRETELCSESIVEVGERVVFDATNCAGVVDGREYTLRVVAQADDGRRAVVYDDDGSL